MANDATINPMYIDDDDAAVTTKNVVIQAIAWVSDATAGDDIAADDDFELRTGSGASASAGTVLISKRAEFAGDDLFVSFPGGLPCEGIYCAALDGGICFIYS